MDQLATIRLFREVVESGSFSKAAERLRISAPVASKRLAQLERHLNVRLLNRTSRRQSLTEAGKSYYEQCREVLDLLDAADSELGSRAKEVRGHLKVAAPNWCADSKFTEVIASYCKRYPDVVIDIRLENRKIDVVAEGFDVALRASQQEPPFIHSRPLCNLSLILVAAPQFVKQLPKKWPDPEPLPVNVIIPSYLEVDFMVYKMSNGEKSIRLVPVMRSDNTTLSWHAARAGIGAAFLPNFMIEDDLRTGKLEKVFSDSDIGMSLTFFAIYPNRQYMPPKLSTFIDHLMETLRF
ncbi:MAG: LysR family transcriptional regulator [Granulosicoccus sp.]